jgi:hypothetical protein
VRGGGGGHVHHALAKAKRGDVGGVPTHDAQRLVRVGAVEVVDVAVERDRDEVVSLSEASHLHKVCRVGEGEGGDALVLCNVPQLARLVRRRSQQLLRVGKPRDPVNATLGGDGAGRPTWAGGE